jgi:hypothetical protein
VTIKIVGYILLFVGIAAIVLSTVNVYLVFTGKAKPIQMFNQANNSIDLRSLISQLNPASGLPGNKPASQADILSPNSLNSVFNLTAHLVLLGIISAAGFKLASLGVMLLRTIEVKLLENPVPVTKKVAETQVK